MSRLPRATATLGLRPYPLAALLWWWTHVATTATGPLRQRRVTHVLLPALAPPHRAYTIDVVGQALLASALSCL